MKNTNMMNKAVRKKNKVKFTKQQKEYMRLSEQLLDNEIYTNGYLDLMFRVMDYPYYYC